MACEQAVQDAAVTAEPFRCSTRSLALGEEMTGTASHVHRWLLVEHPGPWGRNALADSRLPPAVCLRLRDFTLAGVRCLLIRRHGRTPPGGGTRVVVASTAPGDTWMEGADLAGPEALLDIEVEGLRRGRRPGLVPMTDPVYLVCTHGRHDACCAERGRPLAATLAVEYPDQTWECSHIGGDRFAANLVCLPHGIYYGRLTPSAGLEVAAAYADGRLDLDHVRGRSGYAFAAQAAETFVRRRFALTGIDDVRALGQRPDGDVTEVRLAARDGERYTVRVRRDAAEQARLLTCHAQHPAHPPRFQLSADAPES